MTDTTTEPQRETVASSCSQRGVSRSRCRGQFPNNIVVRKLIAGRSRLNPRPNSTRVALTCSVALRLAPRLTWQIQHPGDLRPAETRSQFFADCKAQIHHHRQIMLFDRFFCPIRALVEFAAEQVKKRMVA